MNRKAAGVLGLLAAVGAFVYWRSLQTGAPLPAWLSPVGPSWQDAMGTAPNNYGDPNSLLPDYFDSGINWQASTAAPGAKIWTTPAAGQKFEAWFVDASQRFGIPHGVLSRMASQETGGRYDPTVQNTRTQAAGLMQLMPIHWKLVDPFNPQAAIYYAADMLRGFYRKYGTWALALGAYNAGPVSINDKLARAGDNWLSIAPLETRNYVTHIGTDTGLLGYGSAQAVA